MGCTSRLSLRALILAVALTATIFTAFVSGGTISSPNPTMTPLDEQARVILGISAKGGGAVEAPAQPMRVQLQELGSLWMSETQITDLEVDGNYAYAVGDKPGFMVFDVTNPAAPQRVLWYRNTAEFSYGYAIERHGAYLYLSGGTQPVLILDISDPLHPVQVGSWTPMENGQALQHITALTINGQYLYVLANYSQQEQTAGTLVVASIANPASPVVVGTVPNFGTGYTLTVEGDFAYVGRMSYTTPNIDALVIVNISDPAHPQALGELPTSGEYTSGSMYDIAVIGQRAYVTIINRGLMIADISDPMAPTQVSLLSDMTGCYQLIADGATLYVSDIDYGSAIKALDVTNPDSPTLLGELTTSGYFGQLKLSDDLMFVSALDEGLKIVDVSAPATMSITGQWSTLGAPNDVVVSDGKAYVANGANGLLIADVSNPAQLDTIGTCSFSGGPMDIKLFGSTAYVATYYTLVAVDVTDPAAPVVTWGTSADGYPQHLAISGHYLYSAARENGVYVYDLSDPMHPAKVRQVNTLGTSVDIVVDGNYAYVADLANGMLILDISTPNDPYIVGRFPAPQRPYEEGIDHVGVGGGYAFANSTYGMLVLDVTAPSSPLQVALYGGTNARRMIRSGNTLFLAGGDLTILDIANPSTPIRIGYRNNPAMGIVLSSGLVYTSGFPGLTVLSMSDFFCGDVDNSLSMPDIGDLTFMVDYLFTGGPAPFNPSAGNLDGSGGTDIADLTVIVDYLFFGQGTLNCN